MSKILRALAFFGVVTFGTISVVGCGETKPAMENKMSDSKMADEKMSDSKMADEKMMDSKMGEEKMTNGSMEENK